MDAVRGNSGGNGTGQPFQRRPLCHSLSTERTEWTMTEPLTQVYDRDFFSAIQDGSRSSANEIVPRLMELLHPTSVVDVGCGTGSWLSVVRDQGVKDVLGIDGDYVDRKQVL